MAQVIDASVAVGWCAPSQATALTDAALDAVIADGGRVPSVFWFEVLYTVADLQRRRIVSAERSDAFVQRLSDLALDIDDARTPREMIELRRLADRHRLGIYDAAYLELAQRLGLPLATRDAALAQAAEAAGVALFGPS